MTRVSARDYTVTENPHWHTQSESVSALEKCMGPGKSFKNLNIYIPTQTAWQSKLKSQCSLPKSFTSGCKIFISSRSFKPNGRENPNKIHNFFLEVQNNPYTFLNLWHLYLPKHDSCYTIFFPAHSSCKIILSTIEFISSGCRSVSGIVISYILS